MTTLLSETFTGTNGDAWDAGRWKNRYAQFGGAVNIQGNKGNMNGGTNGSGNAFAQAQTVDTFTDFDCTFNFTVNANTTGTANGYTNSVCFRGANDSMINSGASYRIAFECLATDTIRLQEKATTTWADLDTAVFAMAAGDVIYCRLIGNGSSLAAYVWKNSDSSPYPTPTVDATDATLTSGSFGLMLVSGTDTTADSVLWDDFVVSTIDTTSSPGAGSPIGTGTAHNPSISAIDGSTPTLMSETWTDSNGASWPAQWTTTASGTGALADIQSNKGRMATGTVAYGKVGARNTSALSGDDYTLTVDITIPTYTEWYFFVHVRGAGTFNNTYQLLSSYQFRFTSYLSATVVELYEVDGSGTATLAGAGTMTGAPIAGDVVRIKIEVADATAVQLKQKAWIVGASEPGYTDLSSAVTTDYTGDYIALSCQGGNNTTSEDFLWDNFTVTTADDGIVDAEVAVGVGSVGTPNPSVAGTINAQLASSHGEALFDGAGEIQTLTLEALDAVSAHGEAFGAQRQHDAAIATGAGAANNATATTSGNTSAAAAVATGVGVGHDVTATQGINGEPTVAAGVGAAHNASVSTTTGTVNANAGAASGTGDATGIGYLLDELGDPILDELGDPIIDGASLQITVSLNVAASGSVGASETPVQTVTTGGNAATSAGAALTPSVTTEGSSSTTNVNPDTALSVGAATASTSLVSTTSNEAVSAGAAVAPQLGIPAQATTATATGATYDLAPQAASVEASGAGAAYNPQVDINSANFASSAAIPIAASAPDANIGIFVYPAGITITAVALVANQETEPGQVITIRDRGHTVTLKER